jgi:hypothetical protein
MFFLLFPFLLFVMFVMFGCYIKEKKKTKKWGRGVNSEKEMREKNEMGEGGCMCVVGEKKKERQGVHGWWRKKKKKKRKKEMESGVYVYGGKKWRVEKKEEKKFEREKIKLVLFVCSLCLVQSVKLCIINDLCISLLHTQYTFLYIFLLHCSNFIKICARRCAQIMTFFFFISRH